MAQLSVKKTLVSSVTVTCVNGVSNGINSLADPNIAGGIRILSIVRTVVAGTAGVPAARLIQPTGSGVSAVYVLLVYSSSALDDSTYTVYYDNPFIQSQQYIAGLPALTFVAGQQYSP